jgi:Arc/MetJ-type ribon-helix-helix transcriptional regulator
MSVTITVRIPRRLAEIMRRYREINWSEVVRRAIEEYLRRLEESERLESPRELLERLQELGVSMEDLEPLEYEEEKRRYNEMVEKEWRRTRSTTQAQ